MREAFITKEMAPHQEALLAAVDNMYNRFALRGKTITTLQAYWALQKEGAFNEYPLNTIDFSRLVTAGMWSGRVSWHIRSNRPMPSAMRVSGRPIELWTRTFHLVQWGLDRAQDMDLTYVADFKSSFGPQTLYAAITRLDPAVEFGPATILYLADNQPGKNRTFDRLCKHLRHMCKVRIARRGFNNRVGKELWTNDVIRIPRKGAGADYTAMLDDAKAEAVEIVKRNLILRNLSREAPEGEVLSRKQKFAHMANSSALDYSLNRAVDLAERKLNPDYE